jgi:hypothetical protein
MIRFRSTRRSQRVERLAAATETKNPIVSPLVQEWVLVQPEPEQTRLASERLSLRRAAPDRLLETAATLRRLLFQRPLRLAIARHTVSWRFDFRRPLRWSEPGPERLAFATGTRSLFEAGSKPAWDWLLQLQNRAALGIVPGTEAMSLHSSFPTISRLAIADRIASWRFQRVWSPRSQARSQRPALIEWLVASRPPAKME